MSKKICFAFITSGKINNEEIWFKYLKDKSNIEILIHCYNDPQFQYLNSLTSNIYVNSVPTKWGKLQKVQNFLLEESKKLNCDKFIILSDSCLPIRSYNYLLNKLNNDKSFISNGRAWDLSRFPSNKFNIEYMANQQWCIIDKKHYDLFLNDDVRLYFEDEVILPEESYFSTVLEKNGFNNTDNVVDVITTYVDWSRTDGSSPYYFDGDNNDIPHLNTAISNENILFFRKVKDIKSEFLNIINKNLDLN